MKGNYNNIMLKLIAGYGTWVSYPFVIYLNLALAGECLNPFKPEFTIVIFIHYKPRIAVAILDL